MSKSMTKEQRKNSKYISREQNRKSKYYDADSINDADNKPQSAAKKKKWKPHCDIEID